MKKCNSSTFFGLGVLKSLHLLTQLDEVRFCLFDDQGILLTTSGIHFYSSFISASYNRVKTVFTF